MKKQADNQFNKAGNAMNESPVKSTLNNQSKTFGLVDLWNIHRQRKTLIVR